MWYVVFGWKENGSNFRPTSHELRPNFARTTTQLRTNFTSTSYELRPNFARTTTQLRTSFASTLYEVRPNFERSSRRTNFAWKHIFCAYRIHTSLQVHSWLLLNSIGFIPHALYMWLDIYKWGVGWLWTGKPACAIVSSLHDLSIAILTHLSTSTLLFYICISVLIDLHCGLNTG